MSLVERKSRNSRDDAEALFESGRRLRNGVGLAKDEEAGWKLIIEAAKLGHAVALGFCFFFGRGTAENLTRAVELYRTSAERGHPAGRHFVCIALPLSRTTGRPNTTWLTATQGYWR